MTQFRTQLVYPADGHTAICELLYDEQTWGDLSLHGVDLGATGDARVAHATVVLSTFPPEPGRELAFFAVPLADALAAIELGRRRLLENEVARPPQDGRP